MLEFQITQFTPNYTTSCHISMHFLGSCMVEIISKLVFISLLGINEAYGLLTVTPQCKYQKQVESHCVICKV